MSGGEPEVREMYGIAC